MITPEMLNGFSGGTLIVVQALCQAENFLEMGEGGGGGGGAL